MPKTAKTTHTPTPWKLGNILKTIVRDATDKPLFSLNNRERTEEENTANAEFIVRAVNAHDELVEALKDAECYMRSKVASMSPTEKGFYRFVTEALAAAKEGR